MNNWQTATTSGELWSILTRKAYFKPSNRKFRLLACAGANRMRHMMCDEMKRCLKEAELFTENDEGHPREAFNDWCEARSKNPHEKAFGYLNPCMFAKDAAETFIENKFSNEEIKCSLLRAIFYDPQRAPLIVEGCRLMGLDDIRSKVTGHWHGSYYCRISWVTARVRTFAEQIYQEQDELQYLALADMMEEDGCDMPTLLQALRQPISVRGFWALDYVLGKK